MRRSGMPLQSVRYANRPKRNPRMLHGPCEIGIGTMSWLPTRKAPSIGTKPQPRARRRPLARPRRTRNRTSPPHALDRRRVTVDRHRAAAERVEPAHFVETHDVVGVGVRQQDRVDATHVVSQRLRPQVGRRVDQHAEPVVALDVDRGAQCACPGGRRTGRRRNRSRSWARRATCRYRETEHAQDREC